MKLNKEQRKLLVKKIKEFAKKEGYKVRDYSIFKKIGENFMDMAFNFIDGTKIGYSIGIKKYVYDDIFWEIMNMSENSKESESLRSVGAFTSPTIFLERDSFELIEDFDALAQRLITRFGEVVDAFLESHTVTEYVIENVQDEILQCIAYVDIGDYGRAKEIAKSAIQDGNKERFENEGRGFFQWLLHYLRKRKREEFFNNLRK